MNLMSIAALTLIGYCLLGRIGAWVIFLTVVLPMIIARGLQ